MAVITKAWPAKDPDERLDYRINWNARLLVNRVSDTIVDSDWSVSGSGLTVYSSNYDGPVTTVWLAGGTAGQTYNVTNTITTAANRIMTQTVKLQIQER